ncbi:MAG: sigma-70 family RNA polymerase sigma factor [Eubacterium sp.]|nr:sigma-70 family RNA polymerase sigma factor [Eubacterium sp.]
MDAYITDELINATFLFCRKRISDIEQAKDLSQDILLAAVTAIRKGGRFDSFHSWYWRMARNKYADWVRIKQNSALPLESFEGMRSEDMLPEERVVSDEEISELNYSLSRLAAIYRETVIRFYLKKQTVAQIAAEMGVPEGTVKWRLSDARDKLKKEFDNMPKTGTAAYAPYIIDDMSWNGEVAKPQKVFYSTKIPAQIAVICRAEPKSINEISEEIGVAPVYLEEIIGRMLEVQLLKASGKDKYLTNYLVFHKQVKKQASYEAYKVYMDGKFNERITERLLDLEDKIRALDFYGNDFDYGQLMYYFYVCAGWYIASMASEKHLSKYKEKFTEDKRDYNFTMLFEYPDDNIDYSVYDREVHNYSDWHQHFMTTRRNVQYINFYDVEPFPNNSVGSDGRTAWVDGNNIDLLVDLAENPAKQLNEREQEMAAFFAKCGLITGKEGDWHVELPIYTQEVKTETNRLIGEAVKDLALEYGELVGEKVEKLLLPHVREDLLPMFFNWEMWDMFDPKNMLIYYGLYKGKTMTVPEDWERSAAGLQIVIL